MDIKTGSGAFAASEEMAGDLAQSIVAVANGAGLPTTALMTDMDQVLGHSVGNALEVAEAVAFLTDARARDARLHEIVLALAAEMLVLGRLAVSIADGRARVEACLADGRAAETFARMVRALGVPADLVERVDSCLPHAAVVRPCPASRTGIVAGMDARSVGLAVVGLGGGRQRASDSINPAVGLSDVAGVGRPVAAGDRLAMVHAADEESAETAVAALQRAIRIEDTAPLPQPVIYARIDGHGPAKSGARGWAA
jgi:thymidine phosphorylase